MGAWYCELSDTAGESREHGGESARPATGTLVYRACLL